MNKTCPAFWLEHLGRTTWPSPGQHARATAAGNLSWVPPFEVVFGLEMYRYVTRLFSSRGARVVGGDGHVGGRATASPSYGQGGFTIM